MTLFVGVVGLEAKIEIKLDRKKMWGVVLVYQKRKIAEVVNSNLGCKSKKKINEACTAIQPLPKN